MSRSLPIYIDLLSIYGSFRSIHLLSHRPSTTCLPACLLALPACLACLPCLHALPACLACMPCVRACLSAGRRLLVCLPVYCMYDRMNGWINLSHFQELNALIYPVQTSPILWYLIQHSIFGGASQFFGPNSTCVLCVPQTWKGRVDESYNATQSCTDQLWNGLRRMAIEACYAAKKKISIYSQEIDISK